MTFDEFIKKPEKDNSKRYTNSNGMKEMIDTFVELGKKPTVLVADSRKLGILRYSVFVNHNGMEVASNPVMSYREPAKEIRVKTKKEMEKYYKEAVENKWIIEKVDDAQNRLLGMVIWNSDGPKWYHISLLDFYNTK